MLGDDEAGRGASLMPDALYGDFDDAADVYGTMAHGPDPPFIGSASPAQLPVKLEPHLPTYPPLVGMPDLLLPPTAAVHAAAEDAAAAAASDDEGDGADGGTTAAAQADGAEAAAAGGGRARPRKKLWLCVYPGCHEPPKTHYNCHSHVWDAHIRHQLPPDNPLSALVYKKLPDRGSVKALCRGYVVELPDTNTSGKRKRKRQSPPQPPYAPPAPPPHQPQTADGGLVVLPPAASDAALGAAAAAVALPQQLPQASVAVVDQAGQIQRISAVPTAPPLTNGHEAVQPPAKKKHTEHTSSGSSSSNSSGSSSGGSGRDEPLAAAPMVQPSSAPPAPPQPTPPAPAASAAAAQAGVVQLTPGESGTGSGTNTSVPSSLPSPSPTQSQGTLSPLQFGHVVHVPGRRTAAEKDMDGGFPSYSLDPNDIVRVVSMSPELARLHVCGEVFSERGFLQRSDARFKEDIAPIRGALARVLRITGKTFRYKGDEAVKMGFIAQELESVVPTAVHRDERGLSVDVVSLVPLILEALKDLYAATQEYQTGTAKQLNDALHDALIHVADLDRKFEQFRHSDSEDDTGDDDDDDDDDTEEHTKKHANRHRRRPGFEFDDGGNQGTDINSSSSSSSGSEAESESDVNSTDEEGLGGVVLRRKHKSRKHKKASHRSGAEGTKGAAAREASPAALPSAQAAAAAGGGSKEEAEGRGRAKFRYQPVFGPPLITMITSVFFLCAGFVTWAYLPSLPFVWGYCWVVSGSLFLSLLYQWRDVRDMFRHKEVVLGWSFSMSINAFVLCVIALVGTVITLILGSAAIYLVAFILSIFLVMWVFAVIIHHKYHVRVQSIFVVFVGVLVVSALFFAMLYMSRPYQCGFEGYSGPLVNVPVRVGQEIAPISLTPIPWNCFFPKLALSHPLPNNITLRDDTSAPYVHGRVVELFSVTPVTINLTCSGYQSFECGALALLPCPDYTTEADCKSNQCSWCEGSTNATTPNTTSTGVCGFCTEHFESACFLETGQHSSCFGSTPIANTNAAAPWLWRGFLLLPLLLLLRLWVLT